MFRSLTVAAALLLAAPSVCAAHVAGVAKPRLHASHKRTIARSAAAWSLHLRGVPYVWAGTTPAGFDCSGFTRYVYAHFGIDLDHSSYGQWDAGRHISRADLRPGDLVFFYGLGHVGLYLGHGKFIHAPHTGTVVSIDSLDAAGYGSEYDGAVRVRGSQLAFPRRPHHHRHHHHWVLRPALQTPAALLPYSQ